MQNSPITKPQTTQLQLKKLGDQELNQEIKNLASQERKLTEKILWHIAEVDARKLYLGLAYSSLFEYLTKEIGYTAGSAQRRIDAARLLQRLPEVADKIKEGSLNLGQISKLQSVQRQFKKESGMAVSLTEQRDIIQNLENKNLEQTDLILAQHFNRTSFLAVKTYETKRIQKDESVRIELTFSKEEMKLLQEVQAQLSNQTGGSLKTMILELAKKSLKISLSKSIGSSSKKCGQKTQKSTATMAVNVPPLSSSIDSTLFSPTPNAKKSTATICTATMAVNSRYVSTETKRTIFARDQHCQFKDRNTNKICGSKYFLEIDHVIPKHQNGGNTLENLRLLCASHNKYRYQKSLP